MVARHMPGSRCASARLTLVTTAHSVTGYEVTRHTKFKIAWLLFCLVAIALVLRTAYLRLHRPSGQEVNRLAWEASFLERALPVPEGGPRDGYWGSRMPKPV